MFAGGILSPARSSFRAGLLRLDACPQCRLPDNERTSAELTAEAAVGWPSANSLIACQPDQRLLPSGGRRWFAALRPADGLDDCEGGMSTAAGNSATASRASRAARESVE